MAANPIKPVNLKAFAGVRNDIPAEHMRIGGKSATDMEFGANVDVTDANRIRQRHGYSQLAAGTDMHSLYATHAGEMLLVDGSQIKRINPDDSIDVISSGYTPGLKMKYAEQNGVVYAMNGSESIVYERGAVRRWGLSRPNAPVLSGAPGPLPPGKYAVALTHVDAAGHESGLGGVAEIDLTTGQINVSLPVNPSARVTALRVYVTAADGSVFYRAAELPNGTLAHQIAAQPGTMPATTQYYDRPVPGHLIALFRGRAYVANGNILNYSGPYGPELFKGTDNMPFEKRLTMIAPCINGIYVADEAGTYWLSGNRPEDFTVTKVGAPAFEGTLAYGQAGQMGGLEGDSELPVWLSSAGVTIGTPAGQLVTPNDKLIPNQPADAAAIIRQVADAYQLIVTTGD